MGQNFAESGHPDDFLKISQKIWIMLHRQSKHRGQRSFFGFLTGEW
jgi:hypothetical protein